MIENLLLTASNPKVAFTIGKIEVRWYAVIIVIGMIVAIAVLSYALKREGEDSDFSLVMFLWIVPLAVLFTRLFYTVPRAEYYPIESWADFWRFFDITEGGLTIIGGIFGGALGLFICAKVHKKSVSRLLDVMPFPLLIAQSIGRWGNYVNQELYGFEVTNPAHQWFPFAVDINGTWHYASFFYESMLNLFAFIVLSVLFLKFRNKFKTGSFGLMYLLWYPLIRALLEFIKYDPMTTGGGVRVIQLICFIVSGLSLIALILNQMGIIRLETKKEFARYTEYMQKRQDAPPNQKKVRNKKGDNAKGEADEQ